MMNTYNYEKLQPSALPFSKSLNDIIFLHGVIDQGRRKCVQVGGGGRGRPGFHGMQLPITHRVLVIRGAATS